MASATLPRRRLAASLYSYIETSPPALYQRIAAHHWPQIQFRLRSTSTSLPKYAQPSIWQSIIPRSIRERGLFRRDKKSDASPASKQWNPASFFIIIFTLIGSQAIQLLVLRKDTENYKRRTDAKLELLREVIQRLQNGEQVDVEKLLGTGDEAKEREWEEVLREIEEEDSLWKQKSAKSSERSAQNGDDGNSAKSDGSTPTAGTGQSTSQSVRSKPAAFY